MDILKRKMKLPFSENVVETGVMDEFQKIIFNIQQGMFRNVML